MYSHRNTAIICQVAHDGSYKGRRQVLLLVCLTVWSDQAIAVVCLHAWHALAMQRYTWCPCKICTKLPVFRMTVGLSLLCALAL